MKHYRHGSSRGVSFNHEKRRAQQWKREHNAGGFRCLHCRHYVVINDIMGTANRNHCNLCLWSKHVDINKGDRRAVCHGSMQPVGLTFKHEGAGKVGEIMLIHVCRSCDKISINRIARDDYDDSVMQVFAGSFSMSHLLRKQMAANSIYVASKEDETKLRTQLFGS